MLNEKEGKLVLQTFYTPIRKDNSHEMLTIVHDISRGAIYRVYTDNFLTKNFGQNEELEKLPKLGEFTTTTFEYNKVVEEAQTQGILNRAL